ncbi:hydrolase, NUDIX family [Streptococcus agalactiae ATCC 13813]|jgi:MutT/NUDIX family protein|uniref:Dihydroneopterin triphosphate pyrophosphatase n=1 Tax=Streptococcus agalactiae TaxID=1311 RepID=A0A7Z7KBZ4_STRAG|nr:NUDIX domain-containing protein [Streptococcus agalactiae]EFV98223.1 hydrolase, NUDIX family [Streptococcus agalactiae ATCC 13813]MBY4835571.1 NUDIX domain-containing protein [Streptococcus agalactiae]MBY5054020.1 NUDIX domain-containing protein [Streptococcus agalactiae]SQA18320.1 Dihydroneopterin triphosphate pyrophosphatase [Streptococcus agalactiae]VFA68568.1 Dihydroneopterin triphosphate pyrophosphatase [Streptococcus agalactiae]
MRSEYNVLVIPFVEKEGLVEFCILKRTDLKIWQFVAGGGESGEDSITSALRELEEEIGYKGDREKIICLDSSATVRIDCFPDLKESNKFVIPIHCFACRMSDKNIILSNEHTEYKWVNYEIADQFLHFDLDKTAMWELAKRIVRNEY